MTRIEHIDNPDAPPPNSIVPATTVFAQDDRFQVLLIQRSDNALWALPGGVLDFGETIAEAAVRETKEETGIDVKVVGIVGIYTDPRHLVEYSDGEVRQQFSLCFRAVPLGGKPTTSDESTNVRWVDPSELPSLDINSSMRLRIQHGMERGTNPYIG
ncbi:MAG: NUDIX domain-containing protein [Stackebrandtia sp.]